MSAQNFDLGEIPATWVKRGSPATSRKAVAQMTPAEIGAERERFRKDTRPATRGAVFKFMEAALQRIEELERRVSILQQRKSFEYCGIWSEAETYEPDDFVTHQGGMWHTDKQTRTRPGTPGSTWQLAVKRGRGMR